MPPMTVTAHSHIWDIRVGKIDVACELLTETSEVLSPSFRIYQLPAPAGIPHFPSEGVSA